MTTKAQENSSHAKGCRKAERSEVRSRYMPPGWTYCESCERHVWDPERWQAIESEGTP